MLLQERTNELYHRLKAELNRFQPGNRFYSVREIICHFESSRRVVDAALNLLVSGGALERRSRCGLFVLRNSPLRRIVFFYNDWVNGEQRQIAQFLKDEFASLSCQYDFSAMPYDYQSPLIPLMENCPADIVIICWPARMISREELKVACESNKTIIFMERNLTDASLHCTFRNYEFGICRAVDYFIARGHRNLALLAAEALVGGNRVEAAAFQEFCSYRKCRLTTIDCHVEAGNYTPEAAYEAMLKHLNTFGCNFTAIYVISDYATQGVFRALNSYGLRVPDDVSVIGSGSALGADYMQPPLTTLGVDLRSSAAEFVRKIDHFWKKRNSGELFTFAVPLVITERASVRQIKKSVPKT